MSHHCTYYTHSQHSYVVSIDAGAFANIEIVVGGYHRGGAWSPPPPTPPRASTAMTRDNHGHGHGHGASAFLARSRPAIADDDLSSNTVHVSSTTPSRIPFVHLQSRLPPTPTARSASSSSSTTDARSKRAYEREQQKEKQQHVAEERRREEARRAEARRIAAEEARRRTTQRRRQEEEESLQEERRRRRRRAREIASAWRTYEARWALLGQRQPELGLLSALTFERIPWPVADAPPLLLDRRTRPDALLRHGAIREFLLSSAHSPDVSPKDRIRAALRRWHPDKFARVLSQVTESDRDAVAEGMGVVVRCLNDMLEKENRS